MNQHEELSGTIEKIIFQSPDSGFLVFTLLSGKDTVTVKGFMPSVQAGQEVRITGAWAMHPKFGRQFDAQKCTALIPTTETGLIKFLGSGLINGIGPTYAQKLVQAFGTKVLEIIEQQPHRLESVPGIGPARAGKICQGYQEHKEISHIMVYLQDREISPTLAVKIYKRYGAQAVPLLQQNPYRLTQDLWGVGFKTADRIAQNMGFALDSIQRVKAGIHHVLSTAVNSGHLYVAVGDLKQEAAAILELTDREDLIKRALTELYDEDRIKIISHNERHCLTLSAYYHAEKGVAARIKTLLATQKVRDWNITALHARLREENGAVQLNDDQQRGIFTALEQAVTIITGGPGTGKTTLIRQLIHLLEEHHVSFKLAAPTGRAAKRMFEGTGRSANTLHRLLEFDPGTMAFTYNEHKQIEVDFIIIDEASMIDIFLAHALLKAIKPTTQLLFIGDVDQLPSVGAGNFLNDLIASGVVPSVRLTQIFRQAADSLIVTNAHRVNHGEFPTGQTEGRKDFYFIKEDDPTKVESILTDIYTKTLKRHGLATSDSIVLVPMNRGVVGTQYINHIVQKLVNKNDEKGIEHRGFTYRTGDQVMQIRNNYDKSVFNGDIGTIVSCDAQERLLKMQIGERILEYQYDELDEIVLAYAISIHKSQGSEFPAVIIPIFMQHFTLLQRNLIYTAITRAKKLCILIGQPRAIAMAIKNNKSIERLTFLKQYLTTDLSCR